MSQRAREFVERWGKAYVGPEPHEDVGADPRPSEYARDCLYDARGSGISRGEIEQEFGNLVSYMHRMMDASAGEEAVRLTASDH